MSYFYDLPEPKDSFLVPEIAERMARVASRMEEDALAAEVIKVLRGKGYAVTAPGEALPPSPAEEAVKRVEALAEELDSKSPQASAWHVATRIRAALASPAPPGEDIDWSKHRGSCRVFYAERRCTCGAVPDPRFRDQLAERVLVARCENFREDEQQPCIGLLRYHWGQVQAACDTCGGWRGIAVAAWLEVQPNAEVEARVQAAANQRAAEVETATRQHFGRAYAPPGGPIDGVTKLAQASFRAGYVIGCAAALTSPAPAPQDAMPGSVLPCGCHVSRPAYEPVLCAGHAAQVSAPAPQGEEGQR